MEIVVENITKRFGHQKAVDAISFNVKKGEVVGFWGPAGAGKSTTMKILAGILSPDHGRVTFDNRALHEFPVKLKRNIGYMAEHNPVYEKMNVVDFLLLIGKLYSVTRRQATARIANIMHLCGLEEDKHKNTGELSRGCRQRLGVAQALVHDPNVLILDEPAAGLDPGQIVKIRNIIHAVREEKTVIISSRLLAEIETTCERVVVMEGGKIVDSKTLPELRDSPCMAPCLRVSIRGGEIRQIKEALGSLPGVRRVAEIENQCIELQCARESNVKPAIFDMCQQRGWYIAELTPVPTCPEDVFRHATRN
ncbi:MAG: ABC transporter ATP-binding protein [Odoribacteraceae bacterium]|jgi:ABC-2 type transport system ATP-binding protein|nr:ABC transporter ATP-binding protein [Odoribacteraceae bacterium]